MGVASRVATFPHIRGAHVLNGLAEVAEAARVLVPELATVSQGQGDVGKVFATKISLSPPLGRPPFLVEMSQETPLWLVVFGERPEVENPELVRRDVARHTESRQTPNQVPKTYTEAQVERDDRKPSGVTLMLGETPDKSGLSTQTRLSYKKISVRIT